MSETMEQLESQRDEIEELTRDNEALEERVKELEGRERKLTEAVALWRGKVDRGETWDSFEKSALELVNAEGRVALKRLAAFMRWSLKMTRRVTELEERILDLDLEAEHLASVLDVQNETLQGIGEAASDVGDAVEELSSMVDEVPEGEFEEVSQGRENDSGREEGFSPDSNIADDIGGTRGQV